MARLGTLKSGVRAKWLAAAAPMLLLAQPAAAQDATAAASAPDSGDIVVTAQRRAERLQNVPVSVTALSGQRLTELGIRSGVDIVAQVPGLQVSGAGGGTTNSFNIRGVTQNAFAPSLESPIAVYLDDSYLSLNTIINLALFDLDRVEVLRGPQGTLFGRNATGGLVRYITKRPSQDPDGLIGIEIGQDSRIRAEAAVGVPLSDKIAVRVSGIYNYNDGLIENDIGPNQMQTGDYALRGQLLFQPSSDVDVLLKVQYADEDSAKGGYAHVIARDGELVSDPTLTDFFGYRDADGDPFTGSFDFNGYKRTTVLNLTGSIDWTFGDFTFSSITDYQDIDDGFGEDSDVSPNSVYHYEKSADVKQFSQELRLAYEGGGFKTQVGFYYLVIDGFYGTRQTGDIFFGGLEEIATVDQKTTSWAIFAQGDIDLTDTLSLTAGARYSNDKKDFEYVSTNIFDLVTPGQFVVDDTFRDDGISARLQLNYRPSDGILIYGGVNRGIKSGGFNFPLFPTPENAFRFDGEVLTAWEAGVKARLNPTTTLNISAFYYDYNGYQAFSFDGLAARVVNVNAEMYGGEVEFQTSPLDGLEFNLGGSWLENTVSDVPLAVSDGTEKAPISPRFTLNGVARYSFDALGGKVTAQLDGNWRDSVTFNLVPTPVLREGPVALFNARLSFSPNDDRLNFAVFVQNLTNEYYRFYSFDTSPDFGALEDVPGVPRWFGASATFRW